MMNLACCLCSERPDHDSCAGGPTNLSFRSFFFSILYFQGFRETNYLCIVHFVILLIFDTYQLLLT